MPHAASASLLVVTMGTANAFAGPVTYLAQTKRTVETLVFARSGGDYDKDELLKHDGPGAWNETVAGYDQYLSNAEGPVVTAEAYAQQESSLHADGFEFLGRVSGTGDTRAPSVAPSGFGAGGSALFASFELSTATRVDLTGTLTSVADISRAEASIEFSSGAENGAVSHYEEYGEAQFLQGRTQTVSYSVVLDPGQYHIDIRTGATGALGSLGQLDYDLRANFAAVPAPAGFGVLGLGLLGVRRRRR